MIIIVVKKLINGRYVDFDAHDMYQIGSIIAFPNGDVYEVTQINGSKVTLEIKL